MTGMHDARGNAGEPSARDVGGDKVGQPNLVRIDCPYPLLATGLIHALEESQLNYWRGPLEASSPHLLVLWAEEVTRLPAQLEHARESNRAASIVVLGLKEDLPLALAGLRSGARGFVHAGMKPEQIVRAISVIAKGELAAPRGLIEYMLTASPDEKPELSALKPRQQEILKLVAEGLSNAQIASQLYLTESTIKQHLRTAYKTLGVKNRTEASRLFRNLDL